MSAMAAAGPHIAGAGDMLMYRAGPEAPGKKRREPPYAIRFDIEADDKEMHASLPLGLVDSADKYLPRPMRPYLEEFGVDTRELVELIKSIPLGELPQFPAELRLFDLEQGDRSISVRLYVVGP